MSKLSLGKKVNVQALSKISVLAAIGFILTFLKITFPIFPSFLDLELSELPVIIGTLTMGPVSGVLISLMKNIIGVIIKPVGLGIGQLANFLIGCAYILPMSFVFKRKGGAGGFILGAIVGTIVMNIIACILNYYLLIPVYAKIMLDEPVPVQFFVDLTAKINTLVTDFETLIIFAIAPFNLLKAVITSVAGYFLYRALQPAIKFIQPNEKTTEKNIVFTIQESTAIMTASSILFAVMCWSLTIDLRKILKNFNGYTFLLLFLFALLFNIFNALFVIVQIRLFNKKLVVKEALSQTAVSRIPMIIYYSLFIIIPLGMVLIKTIITKSGSEIVLPETVAPVILSFCAVGASLSSVIYLAKRLKNIIDESYMRFVISVTSGILSVVLIMLLMLAFSDDIINGFLKQIFIP